MLEQFYFAISETRATKLFVEVRSICCTPNIPLGIGAENERAFLTTSFISFQFGSFICCFLLWYQLVVYTVSQSPRGYPRNGLEWVSLIYCSTSSLLLSSFPDFSSPSKLFLLGKYRNDGGAGNDIMSRLNKARNIFRTLNNVWKSSQYSKQTKLKLYQSCVLLTLLYGSECWRMTENDSNKLSVFFIPKA